MLDLKIRLLLSAALCSIVTAAALKLCGFAAASGFFAGFTFLPLIATFMLLIWMD